MKTPRVIALMSILLGLLTVATGVYADERTPVPVNCTQSYEDQMADKALNGITNIGTAVLEMPKNTINTVNDNELVLGLIGGAIKGTLHTAGRMAAGVLDLVTFWLPTEPILQPSNIWENFDEETTYGKSLRLQKNGCHTR